MAAVLVSVNKAGRLRAGRRLTGRGGRSSSRTPAPASSRDWLAARDGSWSSPTRTRGGRPISSLSGGRSAATAHLLLARGVPSGARRDRPPRCVSFGGWPAHSRLPADAVGAAARRTPPGGRRPAPQRLRPVLRSVEPVPHYLAQSGYAMLLVDPARQRRVRPRIPRSADWRVGPRPHGTSRPPPRSSRRNRSSIRRASGSWGSVLAATRRLLGADQDAGAVPGRRRHDGAHRSSGRVHRSVSRAADWRDRSGDIRRCTIASRRSRR